MKRIAVVTGASSGMGQGICNAAEHLLSGSE